MAFADMAVIGEYSCVAMHADQLTVTLDAVRVLVDEQFPAWQCLPIRELSTEGTVNAIFRIGEQLAARFPLRPDGVDATYAWLTAETEASRELLGRTRFPVPEPVAIGRPGRGFPFPWSVQTWLPGVTASVEDPGRSIRFAHDLAEFVSDVRAIGTRGRTFSGRGRGGNLQSHDDWMEICFRKSEPLFDVVALRRLWRELRELPPIGREVMTHGDLIPGNVLVSEGRLAGVLDVGGLGPADPALDLMGAWHLLDAPTRRLFRDDLGCEDLEWERGKAWAFEQAMGAAWYYQQSNPAMSRMARRTLRRITADT